MWADRQDSEKVLLRFEPVGERPGRWKKREFALNNNTTRWPRRELHREHEMWKTSLPPTPAPGSTFLQNPWERRATGAVKNNIFAEYQKYPLKHFQDTFWTTRSHKASDSPQGPVGTSTRTWLSPSPPKGKLMRWKGLLGDLGPFQGPSCVTAGTLCARVPPYLWWYISGPQRIPGTVRSTRPDVSRVFSYARTPSYQYIRRCKRSTTMTEQS